MMRCTATSRKVLFICRSSSAKLCESYLEFQPQIAMQVAHRVADLLLRMQKETPAPWLPGQRQ